MLQDSRRGPGRHVLAEMVGRQLLVVVVIHFAWCGATRTNASAAPSESSVVQRTEWTANNGARWSPHRLAVKPVFRVRCLIGARRATRRGDHAMCICSGASACDTAMSPLFGQHRHTQARIVASRHANGRNWRTLAGCVWSA